MRFISTRLRRLEKIAPPARLPGIMVRFEGPGSEKLPLPNEDEIDEDARVITVQFVSAKDGRPVESST